MQSYEQLQNSPDEVLCTERLLCSPPQHWPWKGWCLLWLCARQGRHHPHLGSSSALPGVSASIRSARGKLLTLCSVNRRAGEACRFPFPQPCEVSAPRQKSSQCPPTEGSNNGKRQLAARPRGAALSQPYPPRLCPLCRDVRQGTKLVGSKVLGLFFFFCPFLLTPLSLTHG